LMCLRYITESAECVCFGLVLQIMGAAVLVAAAALLFIEPRALFLHNETQP
jgi:hypothetical protein